MGRATRLTAGVIAPLLAACVTVNIYFPAAAAEQAADKVIREVWGEKAVPREAAPEPATPTSPSSGTSRDRGPAVSGLLDLLVPVAVAQPNIDVSSPSIREITASLERRYRQLEPLYASGAVGLTGDGLVALRDPSAVPLAQRRDANQLVADENRDRKALYREVAVVNGHPEWEGQIRETFARRWIANARSGWWHQDAGGQWVRK